MFLLLFLSKILLSKKILGLFRILPFLLSVPKGVVSGYMWVEGVPWSWYPGEEGLSDLIDGGWAFFWALSGLTFWVLAMLGTKLL